MSDIMATSSPSETLSRALRALTMCAALLLPGAAARAETLHPGDVVVVAEPYNHIVLLDPATFSGTVISLGPILVHPQAIAVDHTGRILVADQDAGIVQVDPASGSQAVLIDAGRLGGSPGGICDALDGSLFVSVQGASPGVVRVSADGAAVSLLTSGGRLQTPRGITLGPEGALYVAEAAFPADNGGYLYAGHGSIVRIDVRSGGQTLVAADSLLIGPFDIAFSGTDEIWTAQAGFRQGRSGCIVRTRISTGFSDYPLSINECRSRGVDVGDDGTIYVSDCRPIHTDCGSPFVKRLPDGPVIEFLSGLLAVVPQGLTPTQRSTWGALKTIYR